MFPHSCKRDEVDAADRVSAELRLNALEFGCRVRKCLLPTDRGPRVRDLGADHRLHDSVRMGGITKSEAALDAGVAVVGATVAIGNHAHNGVAFDFGVE